MNCKNCGQPIGRYREWRHRVSCEKITLCGFYYAKRSPTTGCSNPQPEIIRKIKDCTHSKSMKEYWKKKKEAEKK